MNDLLTPERIEYAYDLVFWNGNKELVATVRAALREVQRIPALEAENKRLREALIKWTLRWSGKIDGPVTCTCCHAVTHESVLLPNGHREFRKREPVGHRQNCDIRKALEGANDD